MNMMEASQRKGVLKIVIVLTVFITTSSCFNCPDGYFGSDCRGVCHCNETVLLCDPSSDLCPPDCNPRTERCLWVCDPRTGRCPSGCAEGWTGEFCQTPLSERTTSFPVSVVGLAIGVGILALVFSLGATCYCLSRPTWRHEDNPRSRARQERLNRLNEILHHYHIPTFPRRHSEACIPGRPRPHHQKIRATNSLPFLPSYQEATNTRTAVISPISTISTIPVTSPTLVTSADPPYVMTTDPETSGIPARPESPPPPYAESITQPVFPDLTLANEQSSRRSWAIEDGPMVGVWTLT